MTTPPQALEILVNRNVDQVNYHLRNRATDLAHTEPKREFLKRSFKLSFAIFWSQWAIGSLSPNKVCFLKLNRLNRV